MQENPRCPGFWTQIEEFVNEYSESDFSHRICPRCAKKLIAMWKNGDGAGLCDIVKWDIGTMSFIISHFDFSPAQFLDLVTKHFVCRIATNFGYINSILRRKMEIMARPASACACWLNI